MSENPYSAPSADTTIIPEDQGDLLNMEWKALEKLYYRSCNVSGLVALMCLGVILYGSILLTSNVFEGGLAILMYAMLAFYIASIIGLYNRTSWGRGLGIFVCILSLLNIPLGTIIGIMGLFAFFKAPELFGENRITHKAVKEAFNKKKKMRKEEKRAAKRAR